jgi:hypothetical protein
MRRKIIVRAFQLFFLVVFLLASALTFHTWRTWDWSYDDVPLPIGHGQTIQRYRARRASGVWPFTLRSVTQARRGISEGRQ